ncbi:MAG: PASTA domain-containing protein [Oscillospiraceae bacterium]|nr:PASTA domain-containing protein [Oscillospiraceae bacterium]
MDKPNSKNNSRKLVTATIKGRMLLVTALIFLAFLVLIGRLAYLSVIRHDYYSQRATSQQLRDTVIAAQRGTIYDRNGNILARSATVWTVALTPKSIDDEHHDDIARFLSETLDVSYESVLEKCGEDRYYSIVKRKVDKPVVDAIQAFMAENDIHGITFTEDTKRYYPYGNFAAQVLGFVGTDNNGLYGVEAYYESYLAGISGRIMTAVNAQGSDMYYEYETVTDPIDGYSLRLTLDEVIQHYLESALEEACVQHNVKNHAVGIIMNVNTGEIYGMATKPDFDPNDPLTIFDEATAADLALIADQDTYLDALDAAQLDQWRNKAISDIYEPGSVFKVVTASAALETGTFTTDSSFYCNGAYNVTNGVVMHCAHLEGHGAESFAQAIINSCNPAFIKMGLTLGRDTFYEYFRAFGLSEKTGIDLPAEAQSQYYTAERMGVVELASCSYGQSNAITPIQMITAVAAAVNGGYLVQPHIVKEIIDSEGNVVESTETVVKRQVISSETSELLSGILEQVVENANGQNAYVSGFRIGGKSGTAEKLGGEEGEYVASFCAFAPADDPEIACLILLDGADSYSIYGGVIVAPIAAKVMSNVLPYLGIEAVYTEDELSSVDVYAPNVVNMALTSAYAQLQKKGLNYQVVGSGTSVVAQFPQGGFALPKGCTVLLYTEESEQLQVTVPDVSGRSVSYVQSLFASMGLNLRVSGSTASGAVAVSQSIPMDTVVEQGTLVTVEFVNKNLND